MWTAGALRSEARPYAGLLYRIVEGQHLIATNRLAAGLPEQARLEQLVATVKPAMPAAAARKDPLLGTPFRYGHRVASRFRRAGERPGIFYAAEAEGVVIAEASHHRLAFLSRSPGLLLPAAAIEYTVFTTNARAAAALDLTVPPLDADRARWTDPADDSACQALGTAARAAGADAIRYESVRDPDRRACVAVLSPAALPDTAPRMTATWRLQFDGTRLTWHPPFPGLGLVSFTAAQFGFRFAP